MGRVEVVKGRNRRVRKPGIAEEAIRIVRKAVMDMKRVVGEICTLAIMVVKWGRGFRLYTRCSVRFDLKSHCYLI